MCASRLISTRLRTYWSRVCIFIFLPQKGGEPAPDLIGGRFTESEATVNRVGVGIRIDLNPPRSKSSRHGKVRWRFAVLAPRMHRREGGFEIAREPRRIEERTPITMARKLRSDSGQSRLVTSKLQSQCRIIFKRMGDQFGHADGVKQARRHAPGKTRAHAGQDRKACP